MITLIRGGWVLTMSERELPAGDVLVTDGTIEAVGVGLTAPPGAEVIDATGMLVLPGLVDTHRHTWQTPLRHLGAQWSLTDYLRRLLHDIGARFRPEDVYAGTLLGALAALDGGVTTLVDWSHIQDSPRTADASVAALRDAGIRAVFAHCDRLRPHGQPRSGTHLAELRRAREELLPEDPKDGALVTLAMGAHGPDFTDIESTVTDFALARELGIPITTHVAVGRPGPHQRGIAAMDGAGLLGPDLTVVHANGASADDLRRLADHGVSASISPQIELTMPELGASVALRRMLAAGIRPGLSVDSESVASADLFTQMRFALAAHRTDTDNEQEKEPPLPAIEALRLATVDGARTAGLADQVGTLEPGKAADLIMLRADAVGLAPVRAAADAVVLAAHPGMVDTVLVAGRTVKRDGRLLADLDRARELAAATADHVLGAGDPTLVTDR
ncbi:amidohydrolase family protein [Pseudonocardia acaciae]|uniref:amidohydrolase family protein n=1 Tax=Pseudonocardia acaciae TaxID=551276 RepID=UPI00048E7BD6|nr:amidohydrolase family protein [Pseudonocardia acaciae]